MNTVLLTILHSKTCIFIENDFDVSLFYSISYLLISCTPFFHSFNYRFSIVNVKYHSITGNNCIL